MMAPGSTVFRLDLDIASTRPIDTGSPALPLSTAPRVPSGPRLISTSSG
jgi:hypothetical protein